MVARQHGGASTPAGDGLTIIGEGIHVNGRITGEEDLRIEGRVEGAISLTETVHVAGSGVVVATIEARDVVVSGVVVGNVSATNSVSLDPGAKLVGDISAPRLIIADGAAFRGNVVMTEGESTPGARSRPATSTRSTPVPRSRAGSGPSRVAGSGTSRVAARATTAARPSERSTASRPPERKVAAPAPRVVAVRPPKSEMADDDVTVVVRHSALSDEDQEPTKSTKKAKKAPPRGRVPKRGKRSVKRS